MKIPFVLLSILVATALTFTHKNDPTWATFKNRFLKHYNTPEDELYRYKIFTENMQLASFYNDIDNEASYGITEFSDRLPSELFIDVTEFGNDNDIEGIDEVPEVDLSDNDIPDWFDWRIRGGVTHVKNQGQCGSCWAFAAVGCAEGAHYVKSKVLVALSEQELVDCDSSNKGCNGGKSGKALNWAKKHGGFMNETDYPYKASRGTCLFDPSKAIVKVSATYPLKKKKPENMQNAIISFGPIAVSLDAGKFQFYHNGIMNGTGCSSSKHNHAVLVVGWGVDPNTKTKYWIIKNSWGPYWGENGYVRLVRNINACGVENDPTFAITN